MIMICCIIIQYKRSKNTKTEHKIGNKTISDYNMKNIMIKENKYYKFATKYNKIMINKNRLNIYYSYKIKCWMCFFNGK